MADVTMLDQIAKIRSFEKGNRATDVINTGFRFGLLNALAESAGGVTVSELTVKLMLHEPYLKIWCQTAYHFEILDCDELGRFKLQPYLDEVLGLEVFSQNIRASEDRATSDMQQADMKSPLAEYIRTGRTFHAVKSQAASAATCRATKSITTIFLSMIFPHFENIKNALEDGCNYLDIGCGSGSLVIDFAHTFGRSTFAGIDPDIYGIEGAENSASQLGLVDRVAFRNISGEECDYHEEFDFVSMVLTLHEILPDVRFASLEKANQALKKDGMLIILDYPYPSKLEDFRNSRYDYGIIEQYYEAFRGIVHISKEEQDELLLRAGFKHIERFAVGDGGMLDFIGAMK
jgi:SAM-dependent methyltransferase